MSKPVLAFMQNMWVKNPIRVTQAIARSDDPEMMRRRYIASLLFMGCKTGRVLTKIFGEWCERIVWDESTRIIADNPKQTFPADEQHMRQCILAIKPRAVIGFGKIACDAIRRIGIERAIFAPHPAARHQSTLLELSRAKGELDLEFEHFQGEPPLIELKPQQISLL